MPVSRKVNYECAVAGTHGHGVWRQSRRILSAVPGHINQWGQMEDEAASVGTTLRVQAAEDMCALWG